MFPTARSISLPDFGDDILHEVGPAGAVVDFAVPIDFIRLGLFADLVAAVVVAALSNAFRLRFGAVHDVLNVVITERGMIAAEIVHRIGYGLDRAEIALILRLQE